MGPLNLAGVAFEVARILIGLIVMAVQAPPHVEPLAMAEPAPDVQLATLGIDEDW